GEGEGESEEARGSAKGRGRQQAVSFNKEETAEKEGPRGPQREKTTFISAVPRAPLSLPLLVFVGSLFLFFPGIFLLFRASRVGYKFRLWKKSSSAISPPIKLLARHSSSNRRSCEIRRPAGSSRSSRFRTRRATSRGNGGTILKTR